jgi:hypothetical protein
MTDALLPFLALGSEHTTGEVAGLKQAPAIRLAILQKRVAVPTLTALRVEVVRRWRVVGASHAQHEGEWRAA